MELMFSSVLDWLANGLLGARWWQILLYVLVTTHITIAAVTIFLHRAQAHRALELGPLPAHFFRFWLWLTTGMVTREWVAIHRKHHARVETADDPHSPQTRGIGTVLLRGSELYRAESKNRATLADFGKYTPDDWIERHLYSRHTVIGIASMLGIDILLFGVIGLTVWAVQMLWIPVNAAGIINGLGHWWGYRNFDPPDASTNLSPWGIVIGGEELHNNHHTYPTSAKFSVRPWEFDLGWLYIRILTALHLATVKHRAPRLIYDKQKSVCDVATLQAIQILRFEVLSRFNQIAKQYPAETGDWKNMRLRLIALWEERCSESELLANLRSWQADAERSASAGLQTFAQRLAQLKAAPA